LVESELTIERTSRWRSLPKVIESQKSRSSITAQSIDPNITIEYDARIIQILAIATELLF
jgi:hypothetical protein